MNDNFFAMIKHMLVLLDDMMSVRSDFTKKVIYNELVKTVNDIKTFHDGTVSSFKDEMKKRPRVYTDDEINEILDSVGLPKILPDCNDFGLDTPMLDGHMVNLGKLAAKTMSKVAEIERSMEDDTKNRTSGKKRGRKTKKAVKDEVQAD